MGLFDRVLRSGETRKLRALEGLVPDIGALEPQMQKLSDDALTHKTVEFRERLSNGENLDDLLLEAFAVTREASVRVTGKRHFDVQLVGGAALHFGWVAEMKTGEGKTLVSTLPAYLNALSGDGVHVITVNDYLAERDAEAMGAIHRFLGLTVGLISSGNHDATFRKEQYRCDITYGVNNEFGFDYLRDNMVLHSKDKVQRGHSYAIIDEIDSILIDEARTPLIISRQMADTATLYVRFASIARGLRKGTHYEVDEKKRTVAPTEEGVATVERALGVEHLYDEVSTNLVHQLQVALRAKELYVRDRDYVIQNGKINIVDEFTGRILEGRRWGDGLHQAVEAKESVRIKEENQTVATITLQNYFRMYNKLCGMTGTAQTEASELFKTYGLDVVPIPTHKPLAREDHGDLIYRTEEAKFVALTEDLRRRHERGQPVLVGTASVEKSEKIAEILKKERIPHEILNAKQHHREAEIVTQAGRLHAVTVATNMAGRGVDILLGGNPEGLADQELTRTGITPKDNNYTTKREELVAHYTKKCTQEGKLIRELGGLYVLGTERHESRRIDDQLRGRSGRQGDPGESRFYLSLEDDLLRLFATGALDWVMSHSLPENEAIESKTVTKFIEKAQNTVEQKNAEIRKNILKYDEVMNDQRNAIYTRRDQILAGKSLRDTTVEAIGKVVNETVETFCEGNLSEEWDVEGLIPHVQSLWPSQITENQIRECVSSDALYNLLTSEAINLYEHHEQKSGENIRNLERQSMLQLIDQKWLEHLTEMDYLREGIHLRATAQKDPLVEWQRDGYDMFSAMANSIEKDYVQAILNNTPTNTPTEKTNKVNNKNLSYTAPSDNQTNFFDNNPKNTKNNH